MFLLKKSLIKLKNEKPLQLLPSVFPKFSRKGGVTGLVSGDRENLTNEKVIFCVLLLKFFSKSLKTIITNACRHGNVMSHGKYQSIPSELTPSRQHLAKNKWGGGKLEGAS